MSEKQLYRFALTAETVQVIFGVRADSPEHAVEVVNQGFEEEHWTVETDMGEESPFEYFETQIYSFNQKITIADMLPWDRRKPGDWWIVDEADMVYGSPYTSQEAAQADLPRVREEEPHIDFYTASTELLYRFGEMRITELREFKYLMWEHLGTLHLHPERCFKARLTEKSRRRNPAPGTGGLVDTAAFSFLSDTEYHFFWYKGQPYQVEADEFERMDGLSEA